jgi:hypothetical protein
MLDFLYSLPVQTLQLMAAGLAAGIVLQICLIRHARSCDAEINAWWAARADYKAALAAEMGKR